VQASRPDDTALVARARQGDMDAFEKLVRMHTGAVYGHALRFFGSPDPAEDVVQEVFVKVYRSISTFDGASAFSTWLYRITHNACLDALRRGAHRPVAMDPADVNTPAPGDLADEVVLATAVESAMAMLAPEDREALNAVTLFGLTYVEAAEATGVPVGTVKSRVFRARRLLVSQLGLEGDGS
jgi:RNA polymerase sigma-70 factor (ECF subfamily)